MSFIYLLVETIIVVFIGSSMYSYSVKGPGVSSIYKTHLIFLYPEGTDVTGGGTKRDVVHTLLRVGGSVLKM